MLMRVNIRCHICISFLSLYLCFIDVAYRASVPVHFYDLGGGATPFRCVPSHFNHWAGSLMVTVVHLQAIEASRERQCADTIGTVVLPWAGHFQC